MSYVLIGVGGALGSLARYHLGNIIVRKSRAGFPVGTFLINISGAFLLGLVGSLDMHPGMVLLLTDGFLAAFTTFSAFMYEGFTMFRNNRKKNASAYIACTIALGVAGYAAGRTLASLLVRGG